MNNDARQTILDSIRAHLAASAPYDAQEHFEPQIFVDEHGSDQQSTANMVGLNALFKQNLEAVSGHCHLVQGKTQIVQVVTKIIKSLGAQRIAISDASELEGLGVVPSATDIFKFDVGITTAQAAIAETGTLVLDSAFERHRLVSVVPPVHIAIVAASRIFATLGETLTMLQSGREVSPAITFITGPSRTADIELTLTIGVHGPQELYVIIDESS